MRFTPIISTVLLACRWILLTVLSTTWSVEVSGQAGLKTKALFLIAEHEYGTAETLPRFAATHLEPLGIESLFAFAMSDDRASPLCHEFEGLEALDSADVLIMSVRRRFPLASDLRRIRAWIESGKPLIALRTSSHSFGEREKGAGYQAPEGHAAWNTFDRDVLGATYGGHYKDWEGPSLRRVELWPESSELGQPILHGFEDGARLSMNDKLYRYSDLDPGLRVLLWGRYPGEEVTQPVAWINERKGKRVFYTSLGTEDEMALPRTQALLRNAILWGLERAPLEAALISKIDARDKEASSERLSPEASYRTLELAPGLAVDLVASEPQVAQPSFLKFDEKGRLWVVQYRQYPLPAGLEIASRDKVWRNQYSETPAPPGDPRFVPGADRITIHEDTDGDGSFDKMVPFLEGLNLATSLEFDREGVWVLQPPYLLFYHDRDHNDVVDGPPEVHLSGFGIEDTHSIANSLCWGPDGWLYGAQGSTVTAEISVAGREGSPIRSIGQLMWRYHPESKRYEVFSEGGGNIWSCEFDSQGRLLAGANEGGKLGYHYMQGSYNRKNFRKHGSLSNPYAYGYFQGILEKTSQRVTTNLMVYEEGVLPGRYSGSILTANALAGQVLASRKVIQGPTFHSIPIDTMLNSQDRWVRPVYLETGPDGFVYVADWYDQQVNHFRNHEGRISPVDGRIYRLRPMDFPAGVSVDLGRYSSNELVDVLGDERRWYRETARRLLRQRQDRSILPRLQQLLVSESGQKALEALWTLQSLGAFDESMRLNAMAHLNTSVRKWAIRLIGDEGEATVPELEAMIRMADTEPSIEARQQLASTAKRLPADQGLPIVAKLIEHESDASDAYMPLLVWWALESICDERPDLVAGFFKDEGVYNHAMVRAPLAQFTMKRFASEGSRASLKLCAALLRSAPDKRAVAALLEGFEEAYRGRSMSGLPEELVSALADVGGGSLPLRLRRGSAEAVVEAIAALEGANLDVEERLRIVEALGEAPRPEALDSLVKQLDIRENESILIAALAALQSYAEPRVGTAVIERYLHFSPRVKTAAQTLLTSREVWALQWLESMRGDASSIAAVPAYAVSNMRRHDSSRLNRLLSELWPEPLDVSLVDREEIARLEGILSQETHIGDPYTGRDIYLSRCAACHKLHDEGGDLGPNLTGYQRHDEDSLLLAITSPSAEIREGFENYTVKTKDGQTITGFLEDEDENVVVLRPMGGQRIVLERPEIESMVGAPTSLMPPGLLKGLNTDEIADFFAYLRSTQPLNIR